LHLAARQARQWWKQMVDLHSHPKQRLSLIVGSAPAQDERELWSLARGIGKEDEFFVLHMVASSGSLNRSTFC